MIDILIFLVLIILSAFFSSSETAFFSLSPARVRMMRQKKYHCAVQVDILKRDPHRLLITILIGNNIVNLFTASYATVVATQFLDQQLWALRQVSQRFLFWCLVRLFQSPLRMQKMLS
jgi:Mg2+/Co2+ transporter CorB